MTTILFALADGIAMRMLIEPDRDLPTRCARASPARAPLLTDQG